MLINFANMSHLPLFNHRSIKNPQVFVDLFQHFNKPIVIISIAWKNSKWKNRTYFSRVQNWYACKVKLNLLGQCRFFTFYLSISYTFIPWLVFLDTFSGNCKFSAHHQKSVKMNKSQSSITKKFRVLSGNVKDFTFPSG